MRQLSEQDVGLVIGLTVFGVLMAFIALYFGYRMFRERDAGMRTWYMVFACSAAVFSSALLLFPISKLA